MAHAEFSCKLGEPLQTGGPADADAEAPRTPSCFPAECGYHFIAHSEYGRCELIQNFPSLRQTVVSAAGAVHKYGTKMIFELSQSDAYCRLSAAYAVGCFLNAA